MYIDAKNDLEIHHCEAAKYGYLEICDLLIKHDEASRATNVDWLIDTRNNEGEKPLHRAVYNGHLEICDLPIQVNSYVNTIDWDGRTALHLAVMSKRPNICELLIKHGASNI